MALEKRNYDRPCCASCTMAERARAIDIQGGRAAGNGFKDDQRFVTIGTSCRAEGVISDEQVVPSIGLTEFLLHGRTNGRDYCPDPPLGLGLGRRHRCSSSSAPGARATQCIHGRVRVVLCSLCRGFSLVSAEDGFKRAGTWHWVWVPRHRGSHRFLWGQSCQ